MYWKAWRPNMETKICKMWLPPRSDGFHCCTFVLFLCVSHSTWHQEARPCKTCGCGIPSMQNALPLTRLDSLCDKDLWKRDSLASLFWIVFKNLTETKKILCRWSVISFVYKNRDVLGLTLGREWFVTGLCSFITYVRKGHGFFFFFRDGETQQSGRIFLASYFCRRNARCQYLLKSRAMAKIWVKLWNTFDHTVLYMMVLF